MLRQWMHAWGCSKTLTISLAFSSFRLISATSSSSSATLAYSASVLFRSSMTCVGRGHSQITGYPNMRWYSSGDSPYDNIRKEGGWYSPGDSPY